MKFIPAVAIAYVMHKTTYVFPIIGGRKVENLVENLESLEIALTDEHLKFLDSQVPLELGFPYTLIVSESLILWLVCGLMLTILQQGDGSGNHIFGKSIGHIKNWPRAKPISPQTK